MQKYSDFFQTLHDEQAPTGQFGRGTHYSVFRTLVWKDELGAPLDVAHYHDFSVIWDEDHDARVFDAISSLHRKGLLSAAVFVGERKGMFSLLMSDSTRNSMSDDAFARYCSDVAAVTECVGGDHWPAEVGVVSSPGGIISAQQEHVVLYLATISMLWHLGVKAIQ
jgi:hypothetical protein